jgi:hypothetical protein
MLLLSELKTAGGLRAGHLGRGSSRLVLVLLALGGCGGGGDDAPPLDEAPGAAADVPLNRLTSLEYVDSLGVDFEAMQRTSSGIYYKDVVVGTGEEAATGRTVRMNYTGYLPDGFSFDGNRVEGRAPLEFTLGARRVIPGWEQGIPGMRVGGRRTLVIPPELAYGPTGRPAAGIPPNAVLVFDVELLAVD